MHTGCLEAAHPLCLTADSRVTWRAGVLDAAQPVTGNKLQCDASKLFGALAK
jgi:hypothetical protein